MEFIEILKQFYNTYNVQVVSAVVSLIVTIITTVFVHLLDYSKLVSAEKAKIVGALSQKKYEGIEKIKNAIEILSQYEDLVLTEGEDNLIPEFIGKTVQTPACCYDFECLVQIAKTLNDIHMEYGHCLRHRCVVYLIYIKKFLYDYVKKCKNMGIPDEELRWISMPLYSGIHKWYKMFNKELILSMNKPTTKYYAHEGIVYKVLLKVYGWHFKLSEPYRYLNEESSKFNLWLKQRQELLDAMLSCDDIKEE